MGKQYSADCSDVPNFSVLNKKQNSVPAVVEEAEASKE
jgi:hypothetical protein